MEVEVFGEGRQAKKKKQIGLYRMTKRELSGP